MRVLTDASGWFTLEVPDGWQAVGTVGQGSGVTVDGGEYGGPTGWTHF